MIQQLIDTEPLKREEERGEQTRREGAGWEGCDQVIVGCLGSPFIGILGTYSQGKEGQTGTD